MVELTDTRELAFEFEELVRDILEFYFEVVQSGNSFGRDFQADFFIVTKGGTNAVVEVKAYRSFLAPSSSVRNAVGKLKQNLEDHHDFAILVTNSRVTSPLKGYYASEQNVLFYDFDTLKFLASAKANLAERLDNLTQKLFSYRNDPIPEPKSVKNIQLIHSEHIMRPKPPWGGQVYDGNFGATICKKIKSLEPGRANATKFEALCVEALKYVFKDHLTKWKTQRQTVEHLHRYDLISRVASDHDFWNSLISDYRGRYIIFEFKNYTQEISQQEIYSTEKYLLPIAMRSTAIIISRKGMNKNALRVCAGALREAGKLILGINEEQLCRMLHDEDNGRDPTETIYEVLDELLETIER
ncbi:restriction endonuclease [Hellea sp.]|nr:restriction endonuclease [Hellea sp.]